MARLDDLIAKMTPEPTEAEKREAARKRRKGKGKPRKPKAAPMDVVCALCGATVKASVTASTDLGPACKSHPGVD